MTGATGFVGGNLVRALLHEDVEVRALVRSEGNHPALDGLRVARTPGGIEDPESLRAAAAGCDVVFHVAALTTLWDRDPGRHHRVNVVGTRNVLAAAEATGVERVVHTSTWVVVGKPAPGSLATEDTQPSKADLRGAYRRTKWLAEQEVQAAVARGQDVVIASPTVPIGPWDVKPTPTGRIVLDFIRGRMPVAIGVHLNLIDVDDVAQGHIGAWRHGRKGERYLLGNWNTTLPEVLSVLSETTGRRPPRLRAPAPLALAAAYLDAVLEGVILRRQPYLPMEAARLARHRMAVDCKKAISELGLPQSSAAGALERSVRWFKDHGYA
ncbi:MAG: NAD-dependent epimerase/dehydratase family protein [Rhodospirillales bacterium]|nr:NAD-dependent epimerase/dehydratase family protein [Rhodospirillales bacterium]